MTNNKNRVHKFEAVQGRVYWRVQGEESKRKNNAIIISIKLNNFLKLKVQFFDVYNAVWLILAYDAIYFQDF